MLADDERVKLEMADEIIARTVEKSLELNPPDPANKAALKSIRKSLLDAGELIKSVLSTD